MVSRLRFVPSASLFVTLLLLSSVMTIRFGSLAAGISPSIHVNESQVSIAECTSRNQSVALQCHSPSLNPRPGATIHYSASYTYNQSRGYLNFMQEVSNGENPATESKPVPEQPPTCVPSCVIHETAHWIWFADPTVYANNKQYIDSYLDWPETTYNYLTTWLGITLPSGPYEGGQVWYLC